QTAGIQEVQLPNEERIRVLCDCDGWMIIQRRIDGKQDFNKNWEEYKLGFGDMHGDFFLGLENLHHITSSKVHELHISLSNSWRRFLVKYDNFRIGNSASFYKLDSLGEFTESASNGLRSNTQFSTFDRNHIPKPSKNCASDHMGGWWYPKYCGGR
ncbi:hypothetical protein KR093_011400, partial [Drosophila rubida]